MELFIKKVEEQTSITLGFFIRCDDKNKSAEVLTDMYFEPWETQKMYEVLSLCKAYNLNYDFGLQVFDTKIDSIEQEVCIVSKNWLNH